VIKQGAYHVEPWTVRESALDLDLLAQSESVFALSNGHIGLRGNLDEGEPRGIPGTYVNSFYEERPLPYAEVSYGNPESSQTIVNATNGKLIRLLVDDEPLDVRYGTLHRHQRTLDFRTGVLTRELDWSSPADRRVRVTTRRMVSFTQRAVAAIATDDPEADDLIHSARKASKRHRYAAEAAGPALGSVADKIVADRKELQDLLGDYQDSRLTSGFLRDLGGIPGRNGFTFGLLYAAEAEHRRQLRKRITKRTKSSRGQ